MKDGRNVSRLVLDAEDKLGELLEQTVTPRGETVKGGSTQRTKLPSLPVGINKKESFYAQEIHNNNVRYTNIYLCSLRNVL